MAWVLFYDGDCGFCKRSIAFVYQHDAKGMIEFAPLQGIMAVELGLSHLAEKGRGSVVMLRKSDNTLFLRSDACLEIGKILGGVWLLGAWCGACLPHCLRNVAYDLVAKNRHYLSQIGNSCPLPDKGLLARMRK